MRAQFLLCLAVEEHDVSNMHSLSSQFITYKHINGNVLLDKEYVLETSCFLTSPLLLVLKLSNHDKVTLFLQFQE